MNSQESDTAREVTAAEAFEALRREVALMRLGVEALAGERLGQPDYTETLGQLAADMETSSAAIDRLAACGALSLTPGEVAREIRIAQGYARREAMEMTQDVLRHLSAAAAELGRWVEQARTADLQNRRLLQVGGAALLGGGAIGLILGSAM